jgi:hypothetical protein
VNRHPPLNPGGSSFPRLIAQIVNGILKGQLNNQILVTFRDGQTTTTVTDPRLGVESNMHLTPLTANAVTAKGTAWISARGTGTMTWTHANSADVDQDFQGSIFS